MSVKEFFKKPVDRTIEGVIKADDESHILLEVDEYVLTNEIARKLDVFLSAYNNYEDANGVWISGFFGSGKSHILKILSYILEDRVIEGERLLDHFLPKIDDEMLKADLINAVKIPSKSILFNIDQKSDVISANQIDAVLSVFVKVFNEMQGYFPKTGYIANFERDIDNQGIYEEFKDAYEKETGQSWLNDRKRVRLKNEGFAKGFSAVSKISYEEALKVLDKYEADYKMSIEDFALLVKDYIDKQEPGFRLNFFVDEVGQYIADNTKLMTNLQTIAESLATKCNGQSWLVVTSQEDMATVIGDMSQQQGNDFSKIKARFKTPMKLTSADVAEVIQKRLLEKNDKGHEYCLKIYEREENNFETLFQFVDGSQTYRLFRDREHFIDCYPFIPYQFTLFQRSIMGLSDHNAFEGKHSSVGERSMLGVFQDVAVRVSEEPLGHLATYDLMFEGIRTALKTEIQHSIHIAERNLADEFAVSVLKALFLVKFVREFKATVKNISILMIDSFDCDLLEHQKKVKDALNQLENQTYIQRNGELYEYLTDEEQDIEQEIKNTNVDNSKIKEYLADIIYKQTLRENKVIYDKNRQVYSYARKLDGSLIGHDHELSLNIISPFNENYGEKTTLISHSLGLSELVIILPEDKVLAFDLAIYKKTEKYIQQNFSTTLNDNVRKILAHKSDQNRAREADLKTRVENLLKQCEIFMDGRGIEQRASDPKTVVHNAFQELIGAVYPHLCMLNIVFSEENIRTILFDKEDDLFKHADESISEAEREMLSMIQRNPQERKTIKSLMEIFSKRPYGWYQAAILCVLARLFRRGKIEIKQDSNILDAREVFASFTNNRTFANTIIEPQVEFSYHLVRKLKDFHQQYFNESNTEKEAKDAAMLVKEKIKQEYIQLESLVQQKNVYPFLDKANEALKEIWKIKDKDYSYYLNNIEQYMDKLLDLKEDITDPVKKFMSGAKKVIYDQIKEFVLQNKENFDYVEGDEAGILLELLESDAPYQGNQIQNAKQHLEVLNGKIQDAVKMQKESAIKLIDEKVAQLTRMDEFIKLDESTKNEVLKPWYDIRLKIEKAALIPVVGELRNRFENEAFQRILKTVREYRYPVSEKGDIKAGDIAVEYISKGRIEVSFHKLCLETEQDVEEYLKLLRQKYLEMIQSNKCISL